MAGLYCSGVIAPAPTSNYASIRWATAGLPAAAEAAADGGDGKEGSAAALMRLQRERLGAERSDVLSMTHVLTLLAG